MTPLLLLSVGLLVISGFFSASETALFSLEEEGRSRVGKRALRLLEEPRELLVTILLGNLVVNLLFFAITPGALVELGLGRGSALDPHLLAAFAALVAILLAGEILPKAVALRAPAGFGRVAALPLDAFVRALAVPRRFVTRVLDVLVRMTGEGHSQEEAGVTPDALAEIFERGRERGVLRHGEADLLAEIVEMGDLRVREVMTPRVDVVFVEREADAEARRAVLAEAHRQRLAWLPVVDGGRDRVVGAVEVRDLLAQPERSIDSLAMPVKFFPEVGNVLALLQALREDRVSEAVVVDEWGGTAGVVTLEDVFEELVGELLVEGEEKEPEVVPLGERSYQVSGSLSVRDWNEWLGFEVVPDAFETVGGFVTAMLGRIPREGDTVPLRGGLECEVDEVRGRRVRTLVLRFAEGAEPEEGGWR